MKGYKKYEITDVFYPIGYGHTASYTHSHIADDYRNLPCHTHIFIELQQNYKIAASFRLWIDYSPKDDIMHLYIKYNKAEVIECGNHYQQ